MSDEKPDRSPYRLERDSFKNILNLHTKQPWTVHKQIQLYDLLDECQNLEEQNLILDLLSAYENFDENRAFEAFKSIYNQITNVWKLSPHNTLVIALHNDREPGSAQALLQAAKPCFSERAWQRKLIANMTPALDLLKNNTNVVLVDDFIGTGGQFCKNHDWLKESAQSRGISINSYYLASLCIMMQAIPRIEEKSVIHYASHYMEKGITGRLNKERAEKAKELMIELEGRLMWKNQKERQKFSLGFMQSEALFRYMNNNSPNNNFPIFWWKNSSNGSLRETIQVRV